MVTQKRQMVESNLTQLVFHFCRSYTVI